MLEELDHGNGSLQCLLQLAMDLYQKQRVPAQIEKVIFHTYPLQAQYLPPYIQDDPFHAGFGFGDPDLFRYQITGPG